MIVWLKNHLLLTCLVMVTVLVVAAAIPITLALNRASAANEQSERNDRCLRSVVSQIVNRSDVIGAAARKRDDALHAAFGLALSDPAGARRIFTEQYLPAKADYDQKVKDNPTPQPPELACPK